jgi:hypothetical protein
LIFYIFFPQHFLYFFPDPHGHGFYSFEVFDDKCPQDGVSGVSGSSKSVVSVRQS